MKSEKQFTTAISNEEHLARAKKVFETEILPFLEANKKAYKKYQKDKETLSLSSAQKAGIQHKSCI